MILRQYKPVLMARFMEIKSVNPKIGQDQIANEVGCSSSNLQRYRQNTNMLSAYRIPSKKYKRRQIQASMMNHIVRVTSNDLKYSQMRTLPFLTQ